MGVAQPPAIGWRWVRRAHGVWWRERTRWIVAGRRVLPLAAHETHKAHEAPEGPAGAPAAALGAASELGGECERFIQLYERQVLNYLWRMTGDEQAAYDLTQEVFLRAWQHFDALRRYEQPRGWLFRVATNLALSHIRAHAAVARRTSALDEARAPSSSDPAWRLAENDLVRGVLLRLTPKRRAALVLREVYGLTAAEVGRVLGMSEVSVRMALHRAREQFRALYVREGGTGDGQR